MREGHALPPKIANAPELRFGLELYFGAFLDLMSSRSGAGDGPIPWTTIAEYAKAYEFDEVQTEDLFYHIAQLDAVYLKWLRHRPPPNPKTPPPIKRK